MKFFIVIAVCAVFALPVFLFPVCADAAPAKEPGATFKNVEGKEWVLSEVKGTGKNAVLDRTKLEAEGMPGFFTISFREGQISGTGAPNRYSGPYTPGGNRTLTIGNLASTKMLAMKEPDGLNENEYFSFLAQVIRWDIGDGKLELYSLTNGGTTLVFTQK